MHKYAPTVAISPRQQAENQLVSTVWLGSNRETFSARHSAS